MGISSRINLSTDRQLDNTRKRDLKGGQCDSKARRAILFFGGSMSVRVILDIPDEIAAQLTSRGQELTRAALEALALESYRLGRLTQVQVGRLLGLSRIETEDFLAEHLDLYDYEPNELRREAEALSRLADNPPR
jgi:hypothetical protein